jgi:hypothetical protein
MGDHETPNAQSAKSKDSLGAEAEATIADVRGRVRVGLLRAIAGMVFPGRAASPGGSCAAATQKVAATAISIGFQGGRMPATIPCRRGASSL